MDLIFLAYANDQENPLPALSDEDRGVHDALSDRAFKLNHYNIHRESFITIGDITANLERFNTKICLFHYSGHADSNSLLLEGQEANSIGIAQLLTQCPNLKLVILNGCSTKGQVEALLNEKGETGVPVVIATARPVNDLLATEFAKSFYRAMANHKNIGDAFELAMGTVQTYAQKPIMYDNKTSRSVIKRNSKSKGDLWGIYSRNENPKNLEWVLPAPEVITETIDFIPNKLLFKSLFVKLRDYKEEIEKILKTEKVLGSKIKSIREKDIMILQSLPHVISEQLRKLLASGRDNANPDNYFNELGLNRLRQLIWTYKATLELIAFTLLTQLWDMIKLYPKKIKFTPAEKDIFLSVFQQNSTVEENYAYEKVIELIMSLFEGKEYPLFLEELNDPQYHFYKSTKFKDACIKLEIISKQMMNPEEEFKDTNQVHHICMEAEEQLANLLLEIIFLANYRIASIKNIDVKQQRHLDKPQFLHQIIDLEHNIMQEFDEGIEVMEDFMDDSSVILSKCKHEHLINHNHDYIPKNKDGIRASYLNLTPFIYDENAYNKNANKNTPITKILYFNWYDRANDELFFNNIYNLKEAPFPLEDKHGFDNIKSQFETFFELLSLPKTK